MKPKMLSLEINTVCNAKCIMCPQQTLKRRGKTMPMEMVLRIVSEAVELGVTRVQPHLYGESHLHPDYLLIISEIRRLWPKLILSDTTNGSALTKPEIRQGMIKYLDLLTISLDGAFPDTIEKIRPGLDGQAILDGFQEYKREAAHVFTHFCKVNTVVMNENRGQAFAIRELIGLEPGEPGHAVCEMSDLHGYNVAEKSLRDMDRPCSRPFNVLTINVEGDAILCCRDQDSLWVHGSCREAGGVEAAWRAAGVVQAEHIGGFSGTLPICNRCTYKGYMRNSPQDE